MLTPASPTKFLNSAVLHGCRSTVLGRDHAECSPGKKQYPSSASSVEALFGDNATVPEPFTGGKGAMHTYQLLPKKAEDHPRRKHKGNCAQGTSLRAFESHFRVGAHELLPCADSRACGSPNARKSIDMDRLNDEVVAHKIAVHATHSIKAAGSMSPTEQKINTRQWLAERCPRHTSSCNSGHHLTLYSPLSVATSSSSHTTI
mmetsp:Transcript_5441/g.9112  ORF Transcript_5441/g.9112 Transcript_5441/m.9112 type:complete len:203 (+) Transcript_5441:39-647(+)